MNIKHLFIRRGLTATIVNARILQTAEGIPFKEGETYVSLLGLDDNLRPFSLTLDYTPLSRILQALDRDLIDDLLS